jgi:hypothetical protein
MESATTNLSEITADFVRLWDGANLRHKDVRELFVLQASVVAPESVELQVGQETDTELVYPAPTNEQVPGLKGLLEYIDARGTGGVINKHYSTMRKHFTLQEGPLQQVQQHRHHTHQHYSTKRKHFTLQEGPLQQVQQHRHHTHRHEHRSIESYHSYQKYQKIVRRTSLVLLEVFAPVMVVKQVRNTKVTRPIYIFAS